MVSSQELTPPLKAWHRMNKIDLFLGVVALPRRTIGWLLNRALSCLLGVRVRIAWSSVQIIGTSGIRFGNNFLSGRGLWLEAIENGRIDIGENVNVSDWVHIAAVDIVRIGNGCLIGSRVIITDHSHGDASDIKISARLTRPNERRLVSKGPVVLEDNVWLGDGVAVLPGVTIGSNTIVGANSVVSRSLPSNTICAGAPAVRIWPLT
jgi:acetyltransferase-like isoleucine patch superfamily enzyme